ncbi:Mov34/MPN/PAD-1 family protein [Cyclobacterium marinum DSM 745]|uniref:Mov34/MPN/PAD-1 family protein n=1 Tax=Cyclobacterium marinum (strain ATCC 25205 / DSM 745 / LMG 13164 / NCIMB 1802) TaxID=880070 RepID=G0J0X9_CYCMS|nr:Mov34/MPN/PAD-1 family protein [Cyclobacterium marinum DSM 745]|tara:strand:+ start:96301 stop:96720 length:420 start_codon:yes stop_codon:yes gene_type:complete
MVYLEENILKEILQYIEKIPEESCGFLLGKNSNRAKRVIKILPVKNDSKENRKKKYSINPKDFIEAEKIAIENEWSLLGVYHSHLNWPASPSETDRIMAFPNLSYIIISLQEQVFSEIRSWKLTQAKTFKEEKLVITKS